MASIKVEHAVKRFGAVTVLDDVNLTINDGEFFALLGPSGCGKTTTLRAIGGLETFEEGTIHLGNRRIDLLTPGERDIAFVFQLYTLYPHLSVTDNIAFPLRATGVPKLEIQVRLKEVATLLRINHLLNLKPSNLSGGDMQRVTIARALIRNPQALLMDEPLGALDAKLREEMRAELKHLHELRRVTTVLVTHDQVEAMSMSDRMAVMNAGKVQQVGTASQMYRQPANLFVAQFIGAPTMNIVDVQADTDILGAVGLRLQGSREMAPISDFHQSVIKAKPTALLALGVRPESIFVGAPGQPGLPAVIERIEPMGPFDLIGLRLQSGTSMLRARMQSGRFRSLGDAVSIRLDDAACHLFDRTSGAALGLNHG